MAGRTDHGFALPGYRIAFFTSPRIALGLALAGSGVAPLTLLQVALGFATPRVRVAPFASCRIAKRLALTGLIVEPLTLPWIARYFRLALACHRIAHFASAARLG